jgi:hypothetical protein
MTDIQLNTDELRFIEGLRSLPPQEVTYFYAFMKTRLRRQHHEREAQRKKPSLYIVKSNENEPEPEPAQAHDEADAADPQAR